MEENLGVLQKNMRGRSAATEHAASRRPAMVMLVRAIVAMTGRPHPLMRNSDDRQNLGTIRELGLDLGLGLHRSSRSAGRAGAGACRRRARKAGERQHHHSH